MEGQRKAPMEETVGSVPSAMMGGRVAIDWVTGRSCTAVTQCTVHGSMYSQAMVRWMVPPSHARVISDVEKTLLGSTRPVRKGCSNPFCGRQAWKDRTERVPAQAAPKDLLEWPLSNPVNTARLAVS